MSSTQTSDSRMVSGSTASSDATARAAAAGSKHSQSTRTTPSTEPPRQSCTACRARKIKCNKALPTCAQCNRAGSTCFYAASQRRGRPRNGAVASQPLSKEAQLEKRVKQLEAVIASIRGGSASVGDASDDSMDPLQAQLGKLVVGKPYLNDSFWTSEQLKGILDESDESEESEYEDGMGYSPESSNQDFILGQVPNVEDLTVLHPPIHQILLYWKTYQENCESFLRIVHTPTVDAMVRDVVKTNFRSLTPSDELLLFCFYFAATSSLPEDDCLQLFGHDKDILLQKYQIGIKHALARAKFMHSQDFKVLQGLVLYLVCVRHSDDAHGSMGWTMCGLAIRLAQAIGVDRDGTLFKLSPLETEMRRRVWWQLLLADLRASENRGCLSTLLRFDTRLPTHINDADISEDTKEYPKPRKGPSDMTIALVRMEIVRLGRRMQGTGADDTPLPPDVKRKMIEDFSSKLSDKYFHPNEQSNPQFQYSYRTACLITARMNLMIYVKKKDLDREERDWLFQIAIEILEHCEELRHNDFGRKWSWLLKTAVQWHAVAFALAELCVRDPSPQVERAWRVVETQKEEWTAPADSASMTIYQSVRKLLAKAEKNRRTTSQKGSQASSPMSFNLASPPVPDMPLDDQLSPNRMHQFHPISPAQLPLQQQAVYNWAEMVDPTSMPSIPAYRAYSGQWQGMGNQGMVGGPQDFVSHSTNVPDQLSPNFYSGPPIVAPPMAFSVPEQSWPWDQVLVSQENVAPLSVPAPNGYMPMQNHAPQWPAQTVEQARAQAARLAAAQQQTRNNWNG